MARLSRSILSADLARPADQVKVGKPYADVFHIDIMDARFAIFDALDVEAPARGLALVAGRGA